ncbi:MULTISPECIES: hypothetical protein [unclassified Caballeronia]|uniref:hypothetical protein n=1 Tax=unclassified Caballeronia TaxID=2646786 RepID=UPI0013E1A2D5|nr:MULTISPECIES: hypothetical protein [unclassified Caballeronia]QIE25705.1 hypothetical protein SBC2_37750 [Caballeronia sp. SBC2]
MRDAAKRDDKLASRVVRVCAVCRHCEHDRHALEATIPGLTSFSSGFGASVGETRLCLLHDQLISPGDSCSEFEALLEIYDTTTTR